MAITHIDRGWRPTRIEFEAIQELMTKTMVGTVRQGRITVDGRPFMSDELARVEYQGEKATVALPRASGMPPAVYDREG